MKWIYIDLLDNYSTNEWKNLILIDGSSRIKIFELKNRDFQFQIIFIHHWNSKFWEFYDKNQEINEHTVWFFYHGKPNDSEFIFSFLRRGRSAISFTALLYL